MPTSDVVYDEAIALQQQGKMDEAISKLEELLAADPNFALAHSALSVFYSRLEEHDKALPHARKVCELEATDPFSFVALSLLCQKAGEIPEAERALMMARQVQAQQYQQRLQPGEA